MVVRVHFRAGTPFGFSLDLESSLTVAEVKQLAKNNAKMFPDEMKIIFKGRILKDTETLESLKVESDCTMHVVRSAPRSISPGPAPARAAAATTPATRPESGYAARTPVASPMATAASGVPMPEAPARDPLAAMLGGFGASGGAAGNPMEAMMNDPAMMRAAMQMMGGSGMGGMGGTAGAPGTVGAAGIPGPGGMGGAGFDPAMLQNMVSNPMIQTMMQSLASNLQMLQQMMQNNQMLQQLSQRDPEFAQLMSNPQSMQHMFNPQMLQTITQMQQAMGDADMGAQGGAPATSAPGAPTAPPAAPGVGMSGAVPGFDPGAMQAAIQALMGGGQMGAGAGAPGLGAPATDAIPVEEQFAVQLEQLNNMGFSDRPSSIQALQMANGDVNQAINVLIGSEAA